MNENNGGRRWKTPGALHSAWLRLERALNGATTSAYNPFYYLGAIGIFFLWVIMGTGVYIFLFYDITARGAYDSVQYLTVNQWYFGGVMRSLHRYASDGLVIVMFMHAARCFMLDRYKHYRWLAWVTGVVIMWAIVAGGIFGYWMVWDERARVAASLAAKMIENLPIFGLPLSLNFARVENLTDQLFYIVLFIHFSSMFFLFILLLVHLARTTKSIINPPRLVVYGLAFALIALSFIKPATSGPPADLKTLPASVSFDWFFMFIFPALKDLSPRGLWGFIVVITGVIGIVPWLTREKRKPAVSLTLPNCTGCELCLLDCPYSAIQMRPRTDRLPYPVEPVISAARCASCGLCVGACDYSALNLPDLPEAPVKADIKRLSAELKAAPGGAAPGGAAPGGAAPGGAKVMVFACAKGAWIGNNAPASNELKGMPWARVVALPCIGMLQPSMLAIPFEEGVDGVYVAGCREGDCHYRRGNVWFTGRLAGARPPVVKRSIDRARVKTVWLSAAEAGQFASELKAFQSGLKRRDS
ncbi:MAG: hydrogenase iron-sulfur subunit [Deltaproteobacteria bacterium]|nr:hydrogenase iron-sulfur subunit [Deltaproteobacteria bacterium]